MKNKKNRIYILIVLFLFLTLFIISKSNIFERNEPIIELENNIFSNLKEPIRFKIKDEESGISYLKITVQKNTNNEIITIKDEKIKNEKELSLAIELPKLAFREKVDFYTMQIDVSDNSLWGFFTGNKISKKIKISIDNKRPEVSIISNSYQIEQGGAAAVVFKANDENLKELYIQSDDNQIFKVSPFIKENYYVALIAWEANKPNFRAYIIAKDKANNTTKERIRYYITNKTYKDSKIDLNDDFLDGKINDLVEQYSQNKITNKIEKFKFINETLRTNSEEIIYKLSKNISEIDFDNFDIKLFLPLKNSKKVADFADHRCYYYDNKKISCSYHLGMDLASILQADIVSSNDGKVVFAEDNGIYGISVLIDHGLGIYSLYAHCSSKFVNEGDNIKAGDMIAKTGATGLALGDHLHFSVLIQGIDVRPEQFQDKKWIKQNIIDIFEKAKKIILSDKI